MITHEVCSTLELFHFLAMQEARLLWLQFFHAMIGMLALAALNSDLWSFTAYPLSLLLADVQTYSVINGSIHKFWAAKRVPAGCEPHTTYPAHFWECESGSMRWSHPLARNSIVECNTQHVRLPYAFHWLHDYHVYLTCTLLSYFVFPTILCWTGGYCYIVISTGSWLLWFVMVRVIIMRARHKPDDKTLVPSGKWQRQQR